MEPQGDVTQPDLVPATAVAAIETTPASSADRGAAERRGERARLMTDSLDHGPDFR